MNQRSSLSIYRFLFKKPSLCKSPAPFSTHTFPLSNLALSHKPISNFPHFNNPTISFSISRPFSNDSSAKFDQNKIIDEINSKFAEAREEIEAAMESKETVYFNEEAECARASVKEVLDLFNGLLGKLDVKEKQALQRSMGLKIEQLKAELQQLDD